LHRRYRRSGPGTAILRAVVSNPSPDITPRRDRLAVALALLIGFASIFSAVIAWRASLAAIDSSRLQSLAVQEQARRQQVERQLEAVVLQDERLLYVYLEHALAARELQAQADTLVETDPDAADDLDLEAHSRLALARAIQPFFQGAGGIRLDEEGAVVYDRQFVLRNMREGNLELRELRPQETQQQAQAADVRTINLLASAAIIVAALFFLTVAQVARRQQALRLGFFAFGGLLTALGTLGLFAVELGLL
jgi:hypothetical protein